MNKTIVACYCRVSTKKEEQILSLENQRKTFEEYVEKNNMEIYKVYVDNGVSAKSMKKRDGFNQMIRDAKAGDFSKILVKDISRFARNTKDFLEIIRDLKKNGVEVYFINANLDTYENEMLLTLFASIAQEESINLSKRVKFAKELSAKEGRVPNYVYGYDKIPGDKYHLNINEQEARIVKRIFKMYTDEQLSSGKIAKCLNEELVPTKRGGAYRWSQTVVSNILKNPIYIGQVCNKKSEVVDFLNDIRKKYDESAWIKISRPELRIVSDEVFLKANEIRKSRSNCFQQFEDDGITKKRRISVKYPLSNLLVCANDNYSFRRRAYVYEPTGYEYTSWFCSKRDYGVEECDNKVKVNEKDMQQVIVTFLFELFKNKEHLAKKFRDKLSQKLEEQYKNEYNIDSLQAEAKQLKSKRDKLYNLFLDEEMNQVDLKDRILTLEKRLEEIEKNITIYQDKDQVCADTEKCLKQMFENIEDNLGNLMDNAFLKSIFEKFLVYPDGRIVAYVKINKDLGNALELPFAEVIDQADLCLPKYTSHIQCFDGTETAYRQLVWKDRRQGRGTVFAGGTRGGSGRPAGNLFSLFRRCGRSLRPGFSGFW